MVTFAQTKTLARQEAVKENEIALLLGKDSSSSAFLKEGEPYHQFNKVGKKEHHTINLIKLVIFPFTNISYSLELVKKGQRKNYLVDQKFSNSELNSILCSRGVLCPNGGFINTYNQFKVRSLGVKLLTIYNWFEPYDSP